MGRGVDATIDALVKILLGLMVMLGTVLPVMLGMFGLVTRASAKAQERHLALEDSYQKELKRGNDLFEAYTKERQEHEAILTKLAEDTKAAISDQAEAVTRNTKATEERTAAAKSTEQAMQRLTDINVEQKDLARELIDTVVQNNTDTAAAVAAQGEVLSKRQLQIIALLEEAKAHHAKALDAIARIPQGVWESPIAQPVNGNVAQINSSIAEIKTAIADMAQAKRRIFDLLAVWDKKFNERIGQVLNDDLTVSDLSSKVQNP